MRIVFLLALVLAALVAAQTKEKKAPPKKLQIGVKFKPENCKETAKPGHAPVLAACANGAVSASKFTTLANSTRTTLSSTPGMSSVMFD